MNRYNKSATKVSAVYYRILSLAAIFVMILNGYAIYTLLLSNIPFKSLTESVNASIAVNVTDSVKKQRINYKIRTHTKTFNPVQKENIIHHANIHHILTHKTRTILASNSSSSSSGDYPNIFTKKQKENGAIVLHVVGVLYMFLALAIVCDEFFVPALHVISKMLKISDDVAGATFMAAGGSAPELFISVIGVFFTSSNVGFGTIVGSAVFNVLFVIGMCAIFSKTLLQLTWWPLLRDSSFYILALVMLITFFYNQIIDWWESLLLFLIYFAYVAFMFFNESIEKCVKKHLHGSMSSSSVQPLQEKRSQMLFTLSTNLAKNAFRNGALQLVMHTLDPIAEVTIEHKFQTFKDHCTCNSNVIVAVNEKETLDTANTNKNTTDIATSNAMRFDSIPGRCTVSSEREDFMDKHPYSNTNMNNDKNTNNSNDKHDKFDINEKAADLNDTITNANQILQELDDLNSDTKNSHKNVKVDTKHTDDMNKHISTSQKELGHVTLDQVEHKDMSSQLSLRGSVRFSSRSSLRRSSSRSSLRSHRGLAPLPQPKQSHKEVSEDEDEEEPLDLSWPDTTLWRIFYVIKLPLLLLLSITLPDVRRPNRKKLFPITFLGSILWIGGFTYLMVWWTEKIGIFAGINIEVLGLTFLAAGTSIPDLITSVVVARQGLGDMAVSSSIGSNIFDVTVGLPLPWLLHSLTHNMSPVNVESDGLFCSTILLFFMLLAVIMTIAISKWKMTTLLGATMFMLYVVFITITLLIQLKVWPCPIG